MSKDLLYWLDIETTGLDPKKCCILEVGMIVTTLALEVVDSYDSPVWDFVWEAHTSSMIPYVRKMHERNGLLEEAQKTGISCTDVSVQLQKFLYDNKVEPTDPICGSSVDFDRNFLRANKFLAPVDSMFSHRVIDVSTIKELTTRYYPHLSKGRPKGAGKHRVHYDMMDSIEELRHYIFPKVEV